MLFPDELHTARLLLRPWRAEDAGVLRPILEANRAHLEPWIPARISDPAPIDILSTRLAGFATDFGADREWRYGMFTLEDRRMLGEVSLFPRNATGRVPLDQADRIELGYWLRADETGRGFVTEAARAVLEVAARFPRFSHVELWCDARNTASTAVPRRLGYTLGATITEPNEADAVSPVYVEVWTSKRSETV